MDILTEVSRGVEKWLWFVEAHQQGRPELLAREARGRSGIAMAVNRETSMRTGTHSIVREGVIAGFLGATAVAVWFFVVDLIGGRRCSRQMLSARDC